MDYLPYKYNLIYHTNEDSTDDDDDDTEVTCEALKHYNMYPWMSGWTRDQFIEHNHRINEPVDQATLYNYITTMYNTYGPVIFDHYDTKVKVCYNLSLLEFAHNNNAFSGDQDNGLCTTIAYTGNISCLRFAHENGYPWGIQTLRACLYFPSSGDADVDPFQCFTYALDHGCAWDPRIYYDATFDAIKYANERGYPWPEAITLTYAREERWEELIYAYENGQPWYTDVCTEAACFGNLSILKYVVEHGCPFDRDLFQQCMEELANQPTKKNQKKC